MVYTGNDLAFIIPTKDRPRKISNLLDSFIQQTVHCARIIIVDGGKSIKSLVDGYAAELPVEYYSCSRAGQIRQRNMGIEQLDKRTKLVGCLDDDIVLLPDAIEKMLAFWNDETLHFAGNPAGVGFNVINEEQYTPHWFMRMLLGRSIYTQGKVFRSGFNTPVGGVRNNIQSEWLNGGASVWRQEILASKKHHVIDSSWAISEDLIFSYPIGKHSALYVCANACVQHEHVMDQFKSGNVYYKQGKYIVLWRLLFVLLNRNLSLFFCIWNDSVRGLAYLIQGVFVSDRRCNFYIGIGMLSGIFEGIFKIHSVKRYRMWLAKQ